MATAAYSSSMATPFQGQYPSYQQPQVRAPPGSQMMMATATPGSNVTSSPYYSTADGGMAMSETTERRRVRSVILNEEFIGQAPEESVRYIEVPYVEEVVRHVPRKEYVEIEKRVPKYEYEWTERIVEVPQIQYVDKTVEVPQYHEVVKHVPRREVVEVPREVIRNVPKIETRVVERVVEVPGEIIEVPKPYTVETKIPVAEYYDKEVPMVVAQTVRPILSESNDYVDVDVVEYEPEVIPVDIHVPKTVQSQIVSVGVVEEQHRMVKIPPAQFNSMLRLLNPHIADGKESHTLPYLTQMNGAIPFLATSEMVPQMQPLAGVDILGWHPAPAPAIATANRGVSGHTQNSRHHTTSHRANGGKLRGSTHDRSGSPSQQEYEIAFRGASGNSHSQAGNTNGSSYTTGTGTVSRHTRNRTTTSTVGRSAAKPKKGKGMCPC